MLVILPFLPETHSPNILYRRAVRLRATTGRNYRSNAELVKLRPSAIALDAAWKPVEILIKDPAIAYACVYTAIVYGTYYSFFGGFPIAFAGIYGFGLGGVTLVFWAIVVGCLLASAGYIAYLRWYFIPLIRSTDVPPERYLRAAFPSVYLLPAGMFIFAWTAREDVHWIVPMIGIGLFACTSFVFFQCIICYIALSYPDYLASLFAGNDFGRSMAATGFVMFSTPMYRNLGIDRGMSLLGGLAVIGPLGLHVLYSYGAWLRSKSRFAVG